MRILLFNSPNPHKKFNENLSFVDEEFGCFPPLDLCWISAISKENGHQSKIIDLKSEKLATKKIIKNINLFKPDIFFLNIHSLYTFFEVLGLAKLLKKHFKLPVLVGGYTLRTHYQEIFSYKEFDYAIIGSAIKNLPEFLQKIDSQQAIKNIQGLAYRDNLGKAYFNLPNSFEEDISSLPLPDRSSLPNKKYYSIISKYKNFTIMLSSFSCPFKCTFCAINKFPYSQRKLDRVLAEIDECYKKYKIREIDFFDATFVSNKKYVTELCNKLIARKYQGLRWSCRTTIESVDNELLQLMSRSGCKGIYYGIESCNKATLKTIQKPLHLEKVTNTLLATKKAGIHSLGFFMIGLPNETEEDIRETINYAKKLPLTYAQFSIMIAKPNSQIESTLESDKDFWKKYILGEVTERRIASPWCPIPYNRIKQLTKRAYLEFYFRPCKIIFYLLDIRSFDEILRYFKVIIKSIF